MKNDSIPISEKHGINPALILCARCGQETGEIVLLGQTNKSTCPNCLTTIYGTRADFVNKGCPHCGSHRAPEKFQVDVEAPRHLRGTSLCDPCKTELTAFENEIRAGGIRWKCKDCQCFGVLKATSDYAQHLRANATGTDWDHTGIELTRDNCPACREEGDRV